MPEAEKGVFHRRESSVNIAPMSQKILYRMEGKVACIVMEDGKANAINLDFIKEMRAALAQANHEAKAILIEGKGKAFCAGLDLKALPTYNTDQARELMRGFIEMSLFELFSNPLPVVACIEGHCLAGGQVIALGCDKILAAEGDYKLGLNEVAIGINMPDFLTHVIRQIIPPAHLTDVLLTGKVYNPQGALAAGLVHEVHDKTVVRERAYAMAKSMGNLSEMAFSTTKKGLRSQMLEGIKGKSMDEIVEETLKSSVFAAAAV